MGKRNKSKRFVQQGKNAVEQHDKRFPYHMTYSEASSRTADHSDAVKDPTLGGF
ncbi:hypothetical protein [Jeotgalibacillus proteolyticus]|uniref:hypothetical protein n=1 Tax=Jeotgalibacillus proteolyticus TaxID=2082395 RepID=UPI001430CAE1|nr:hypothetical protein [Jeotgalibacillus proteolyticus]